MFHTLFTDRLVLRPYQISDAPRASELAGDREVAETTFVPHPYTLEIASNWIQNHKKLIENGDAYPFAVVLKEENVFIGTMTIRIDKLHNKGELAYWIGKKYWGKGYATESAKKVIEFGFNKLKLNRIWAPIMNKNKASGKVLEKVGMKYEGTLKEDVLRWDNYEDVDIYSVLKRDYK
jgi:[ribosomal protein S5]-alanine N-acetyltransferase